MNITAKIEASVIKKTNKNVYFKDGSHMNRSDFHKVKQGLRKDEAIIHQSEFKDSVGVMVVSMKNLDSIKSSIQVLEKGIEDNERIEYELDMQLQYSSVNLLNKPTYKDLLDTIQKGNEKERELELSIKKLHRVIYRNLALLPELDTMQVPAPGIKFIIQKNNLSKEYRMVFDPFQLMSNFHSSLSNCFRDNDYGTVNGGWLVIIGNKVILFAKSGDYGVYDDDVALEAAKELFPNKEIFSHAGKSFSEIAHLYGQ